MNNEVLELRIELSQLTIYAFLIFGADNTVLATWKYNNIMN
jgi:hypothetical protein